MLGFLGGLHSFDSVSFKFEGRTPPDPSNFHAFWGLLGGFPMKEACEQHCKAITSLLKNTLGDSGSVAKKEWDASDEDGILDCAFGFRPREYWRAKQQG